MTSSDFRVVTTLIQIIFGAATQKTFCYEMDDLCKHLPLRHLLLRFVGVTLAFDTLFDK